MGLSQSIHSCYDITPKKINSIQDLDTVYSRLYLRLTL
jgi:hypothetical protein